MSKRLVVTYYCKSGERRAFIDAVKEAGVYQASKQDAGCLQYEYALSMDNEDILILLERWESEEALATHLAQPHIALMGPLKERYTENVTLEKYDA